MQPLSSPATTPATSPAGGPRISVVVPTRDRPELLTQALASAVTQTRPPVEVIVVFDGQEPKAPLPTHHAGVPIRSLAPPGGRRGPSCRNLGAAVAVGDWLAFLDDDDLWAPDKLAAQAQVVTGDQADFVYTDYYRFSDATGPYRIGRLSDRHSDDPDVFRRRMQLRHLTGSASTFMVRRASFEQVGGFDPSLHTAEDYDLCLRLAAAGARFRVVPRPLVYYRLHPAKISFDLDKRIAGLGTVLDRRLQAPDLTNPERRAMYYRHHQELTLTALRQRQPRLALRSALAAIRQGGAPTRSAKLLLAVALGWAGWLEPFEAWRRQRRARHMAAAGVEYAALMERLGAIAVTRRRDG